LKEKTSGMYVSKPILGCANCSWFIARKNLVHVIGIKISEWWKNL
jgi:hypothetical protein